jgi:group II intron reverse transcriptase/maturase
MNGDGKSDSRVVPAKPSNKDGRRRRRRYGDPYTGTKAETPDTAKGEPTVTTSENRATAEGVEERRLAKGNPRRQNVHRTQGRERMRSALARVRAAAEKDRELQFSSLLHHVYNTDTLREAYFRLARKAAPGVDGVTWQQYGEGLEAKLEDLSARLKRGAYRARPVRRAYVPKEDGRERPIGVTTLEDKVVQQATVRVLNAVYEVDFLGFSYGFRPERSQHNALDALTVGLERRKVNWVLDADVQGFFDAISHEWLVKFVEHRIADRRVVRLIQKWLNAGVLENGKRIRVEEGTPQGGSISPLLANIYLHYVFDLWAHQWRGNQATGDVIIVRYADDFVVGFQHRTDAERFLTELRTRFGKFGLTLHPDKTRLIEFGRFAESDRKRRGKGKPQSFDFLGFTHYCSKTRKGKYAVKRRTMSKRMRRKLKEVKAELRLRMHDPVPEVGTWLGSVLDGHFRYYGVPHNRPALDAFRSEVARMWRRTLSRRSQKGYVTWERMARLKRRWFPSARIHHPYPDQRLCVST